MGKTSRNEWAKRRIERILERPPEGAKYETKRCPICISTVEPERLHGGRVAWRCRFCPYISIVQSHRGGGDHD